MAAIEERTQVGRYKGCSEETSECPDALCVWQRWMTGEGGSEEE